MDRNQKLPCPPEILDSLWIANSPPSFLGSASTMVINYDENSNERSLFPQADKEENGNEELFESYTHQPEKKRRLLPGQVQFLEKSFEIENKLEPERKVQLAKELDLQPRQVAIWFQNRRARYKNKQLEKDYDLLKSNYDNLKLDYENLFKENEKLKIEVQLLNEKTRLGEKRDEEHKKVKSNDVLHNAVPNVAGCKHEDVSSARSSDVLDLDSPHYTEDSSNNIFHEDETDDSLCKRLLNAPSFLKLEDDCYDDLQPNPCTLGLNVEDHGTWFWN